ncbi:MAG: ABC transporter permease [Saprospiraceae bacterium]
MFKNYIKLSWRNLTKNRSHSLINLLGLSIGIACCLLILLWVTDELSFDKWNEKADRTFRVTNEINFGGMHKHYAVSPSPVAPSLRSDFPEVEAVVRFRNYGGSLVKRGNQSFNESNIIYCDSTLFDVFSLQLVSGNSKQALVAPNSVVINEKIARKYFPNDNPIGELLNFDNQDDLTVTGVFKDMPDNSHFNYDFFVSLSGNEESQSLDWLSNNFYSYYVLREGTDDAAFEAKIFPFFKDKYITPQITQTFGATYEDFEKDGSFIKYHFQPITDIHLNSDLAMELSANGNIQYVWTFVIVALFILLIACVNFMNLSTARSSVRAKEIGVRKVLGSLRSNLIHQFLIESVLIAGMAFVIGIMMAYFALPYFNNLADKQLSLPFSNIVFWAISIIGILLIGLLAGSYPAFYLSAFEPVKTLKGKILDKGGNLNLRNGLVVFQFLIAVLLIVGTLVINQQIHFIQNKKIGFDREQVLILENAETLKDRAFTLKKELLNHSKISQVSVSGYLPVPSYRSNSPLCKSQEVLGGNCVSIQMWNVDEAYLPTFGMELIAGRNFSPEMLTDSNAVIINETAAGILGFEDPIGKKVYGSARFDPQSGDPMPTQTIIGVVKDFHFESLRQDIGALSLWLNPYSGNLSLKTNTDKIPTLISDVEKTWKKIAPELPFSYRFLDESFDQLYRTETRISKLFSIFSGLSIFIACLGLFGLAAFTTERRFKEIAIRKVLGASVPNLVGLLSKDFLKLVLLSLIISIPIAWYLMNQWLTDFAYRIEFQWWIFLAAGFIAIAIAFLTVSFQAVKAARVNPVNNLKE